MAPACRHEGKEAEAAAVLGVKLSQRQHASKPMKNRGWSVLCWGLAGFALCSAALLSLSIRDQQQSSFHRRLSWSSGSSQVALRSFGSSGAEYFPEEAEEAPTCFDCTLRQKGPRVPSWPPPELAAVGFAMQKHYGRLDARARRPCNLRRAANFTFNNHSNYDFLTRFKNPGIPSAFFDHEISFKYEKIPGRRAKLEDYQCYLLLRGQDYGALRQNPLVQAKPFALNNPFGPVIPDNKLRMVAVVFPQYHAFKENDRFWGTNFSEWTNLKLTFFNPWSFQPIKHPIQDHGGYYNFLDFEHRSRVGQLAKYYGIEALAYHHYWFDCNTIFLESVILRMLEDGQPDVPFMLVWANEAWTRHWTGETGEFLQTQEYGDAACWKEHFFWLLKLFKHPKYLKEDGKPIFSIYLTSEMRMLKEMMDLWRDLAVQNGLPGLHIVQCLGHKDRGASKHVDAILEYQPNLKRGRLRLKFKDQRLLNAHYRGEYLGWDNYPRHNLDPKFVVGEALNDDPIHVEERLEKRMALARRQPNNGSNLFFLVAWNEWGEGNILEPNNIFGYGNLNAAALAYNRSRYPQRPEEDVLEDLLDLMEDCKLQGVIKTVLGEDCKLQLDTQFYIDMSRTKLDHLLKRPESKEVIFDNWERKGFKKGREFRLIPEFEAGAVPNTTQCKRLLNVVLDKTTTRYYLEIEKIRSKHHHHHSSHWRVPS